jgi:hypothetical protein
LLKRKLRKNNYLFFLNQLIRNKIPIKNAVPEIIAIPNTIDHSNVFLINKKIYNNPAKIKAIPPTISYFQEINKTTNNMIVGILCINNPSTVSQKLNSEEKTSNDINAKKNMNIIDKILGVQYINFPIFLTIKD